MKMLRSPANDARLIPVGDSSLNVVPLATYSSYSLYPIPSRVAPPKALAVGTVIAVRAMIIIVINPLVEKFILLFFLCPTAI